MRRWPKNVLGKVRYGGPTDLTHPPGTGMIVFDLAAAPEYAWPMLVFGLTTVAAPPVSAAAHRGVHAGRPWGHPGQRCVGVGAYAMAAAPPSCTRNLCK